MAARGNRFIRECFAIGKEVFGRLDWPCEMSFTGKGHAHLVVVAPTGKYRLKVVCTPADHDDAKVYFRQSCERLIRTALAGKAWGQIIPVSPSGSETD